jgi:hypothetical protein
MVPGAELAAIPWTVPLTTGSYVLGSRFGEQGSTWAGGVHTGQDFVANTGTSVYAARAGTVSISHPAWAGNLVLIDDGFGLQTWYAHLSSVAVKAGTKVLAGALVGGVGKTGDATFPHLHFEIRIDSRPVDPMPLMVPAEARTRWDGYPNGALPDPVLCDSNGAQMVLRCDAVVGYRLLSQAYLKQFHSPLCVSLAYLPAPPPALAPPASGIGSRTTPLATAAEGSNHGYGREADFCGGVERVGTLQHRWILANAAPFGWSQPAWAQPTGAHPSPWHFEFNRV